MYDTSIIPEVYMRKQVEMQHPPKCGELNNELAAQQHTYISAEYIEAQTNHNSDMQAANRCRLEMAGTNHHFPSQIQDVPSSITNSQPKITNHAGSVCRVSNNHPSHYQASTWNSTVYPARSGLHSPSEHLSPSCAYQNSISTPYMLPVQRGYYHQSHRNYMANQWFQEFSQDPTMRSRPCFTSHQTKQLENEFHSCQYITRRRRIEIAYALNLTEKQIKTWFQNRRVKERKVKKIDN